MGMVVFVVIDYLACKVVKFNTFPLFGPYNRWLWSRLLLSPRLEVLMYWNFDVDPLFGTWCVFLLFVQYLRKYDKSETLNSHSKRLLQNLYHRQISIN